MGLALTAAAAMLPSHLLAAADMQAHPGAVAGLLSTCLDRPSRQAHPGSFDAAQQPARTATFWGKGLETPIDSGESYDPGGPWEAAFSGLSGRAFSSARSQDRRRRVLILDKPRRLWRHAKTQRVLPAPAPKPLLGLRRKRFPIERPRPRTASVAKRLIRELGIGVASYSKYVDENLYRSFRLVSEKSFFDQGKRSEADRLVINPMKTPVR